MVMHPTVVDIYSGNPVGPPQFKAMHEYGIRGVIHKASEGGNYPDSMYRTRRPQILDEGMLIGAYHFCNSSPVETQADFFLNRALPQGWDGKTLLGADWEDNRYGVMDVDQMEEFCTLVFKATGQRPAIYGSNTPKRLLGNSVNAFLGKHRLWLAEYGYNTDCQASWEKAWLWQYTGDGLGPLQPHDIPGLHNDDLDQFLGTDLAAEWVDSDHAANVSPQPIILPATKPIIVVNPNPTQPVVHNPPAPTQPTFEQKAWNWFLTH